MELKVEGVPCYETVLQIGLPYSVYYNDSYPNPFAEIGFESGVGVQLYQTCASVNVSNAHMRQCLEWGSGYDEYQCLRLGNQTDWVPVDLKVSYFQEEPQQGALSIDGEFQAAWGWCIRALCSRLGPFGFPCAYEF
jgi:hypothetical protein